ncbi:GntR family transcriptional regulator [Streptomyces sp. NPDC051909]|uniref:GntR family transcriptional regulator n=1 Tax=Streptomyces sp. NPDC051909 TaxID=3154944 RepID=UPI0034482913
MFGPWSKPSKRLGVIAPFAILISAGRLPEGERLPRIRQLASDLGLAAGTVASAYRELEVPA